MALTSVVRLNVAWVVPAGSVPVGCPFDRTGSVLKPPIGVNEMTSRLVVELRSLATVAIPEPFAFSRNTEL